MTATFTWTVSECERTLADPTDGITVAHWRVNATEKIGDAVFTATSYGSCGFTPDSSEAGGIEYASVTEANVIDWCHANGVDKDAVEASLQASITAQANPTTGTGTPWA